MRQVQHLDDPYHKPRDGWDACGRVAVIVLGDLARSPRMLYHAQALADCGAEVDLIGYADTPLDSATAGHPRIHLHPLAAPAVGTSRRLFVVRGLWRVTRQSLQLLRLLATLPRPTTVLVQNPPAVPTLLLAWLAARTRGARLVVDWHNFGYAMLTLRLPPHHPIVRLARAYERAVGGLADHHLCVSRAMAGELATGLGIRGALVLHDRPAERFTPASATARPAIRAHFAPALRISPSRPAALAVSPMGWTADEDVGLLLEAAARYDEALARDGDTHPDLVLVVTGAGPLREHWSGRMDALGLRRVHLRAHWLSAEDYPAFLAAADIGVSVHRSTSGCDLPMKIADLHGAGVPVCAFDYGPCLTEMLVPGEERLRFTTADELAVHLLRLLRGFPAHVPELERIRSQVERGTAERWRDGWSAAVGPLFGTAPHP